MYILLISDIHSNFPALEAVDSYFKSHNFDVIINCGDSIVYAPFPNETLDWLKNNKAISILGNTDKKVIKILRNQPFSKPRMEEKRIMYTWTADQLTSHNSSYLLSLKKKKILEVKGSKNKNIPHQIGIYHGSPAKNHEFLFDTTPSLRFFQLAELVKDNIICCGHSHTPFHKKINKTHFVNPGSVGRMFDENPTASCATLTLEPNSLKVSHFRIPYNIKNTVNAIRRNSLPEIYCDMYTRGKKLN